MDNIPVSRAKRGLQEYRYGRILAAGNQYQQKLSLLLVPSMLLLLSIRKPSFLKLFRQVFGVMSDVVTSQTEFLQRDQQSFRGILHRLEH